ncbi:hypothetical protein NC652_028397 [Populus alba x Populus x berolinensis]|nr:hypothetical protein NC652_028397 [Populus alba x Populus x berolinensis]
MAVANRCHFCRRKVGLTGFKCRCIYPFCSQHRYSGKHNCVFDYKIYDPSLCFLSLYTHLVFSFKMISCFSQSRRNNVIYHLANTSL